MSKERGRKTDTRRHCCTTFCSQSASAKGRRAIPEDEEQSHNIKQCDVRETEREVWPNCIAQAGNQTVSQSDLERKKSSVATQRKRRRKPHYHSPPADGPVGLLD